MPNCPITRQPPGVVIAQVQEEVCLKFKSSETLSYLIFQVCKEFPFLANYRDNWPTRDMISQYLSKSHGSQKHFPA